MALTPTLTRALDEVDIEQAAEMISAVDLQRLGGYENTSPASDVGNREESAQNSLLSNVHSGGYQTGDEHALAPGEADGSALGASAAVPEGAAAVVDATEGHIVDLDTLLTEAAGPIGNPGSGPLGNAGLGGQGEPGAAAPTADVVPGPDSSQAPHTDSPRFDGAAASPPAAIVESPAASPGPEIALDLSQSLGDLDLADGQQIVLSGIPADAVLSAGNDNGDGSWVLSPDELPGLTITPPADGDDDFTLTVTTTPAPETSPVLETTPDPEPTPVLETTPAPETSPVLETTPAPETTPVIETTPAPETSPALETTPAPETTPAAINPVDVTVTDSDLDFDSRGAAEDQILIGGSGDDVLYGGAGNDTLYGCESRMAVMSAAWFVEFRQRLPWLLHVD